jgi:drug/metabolite transporter (DMT)-like permease
VVWLRFGIGVAVLGLTSLLRGQLAWPERGDLPYFAVLGFLGITLHQWLQSVGLLTAQATTSAWIVATNPVFIALLGWLVLKERLAAWQAVGILLAAGGVLLVVTNGDFAALAAGRFGAPGDFLILASSPNWAVFSTLSRRGLQKYPATRLMFFVMGLGWLFSTVFLLAGPGFSEIERLALDGWLAVGFLGIFCSGFAYLFWYDALQALPVAQVGAFLYLEPFVTVMLAALILDEPLLAASIAGGGVILLGVWLVNRPAKKMRVLNETE